VEADVPGGDIVKAYLPGTEGVCQLNCQIRLELAQRKLLDPESSPTPGPLPESAAQPGTSKGPNQDADGRPVGLCFISTPQVRMNKNTPLNQN